MTDAARPETTDAARGARRVLSIDVGQKNLALCALVPGDCPRGADDRIAEWTVTDCEPSAAGVAAALAALPWTTEPCDQVVVERQPNRNPTMTRLQHYLEMYFAVRGVPVTVQDAKHKLAFAAGTPWWPSDDVNGWSYHVRKRLSVRTTAAFLAGTDQEARFRDLFSGTSKKDDLGDCLLQGMAYCHHVRPRRAAAAEKAAAKPVAAAKPATKKRAPRKRAPKELPPLQA